MRAFVNKLTRFAFLALACSCSGVLFFLIQREFIIIQWSYPPKNISQNFSVDGTTTRIIMLYCWNNKRLLDHQVSLIWYRTNPAENLKTLVSAWIDFAHSEHILSKSIVLQNAWYASHNKEAYLSFDQPIFDATWSIKKKIFLMQSLLKTIGKTDLQIQHLVFLINHQPMIDDHLDFSYPWPLDGFISNF